MPFFGGFKVDRERKVALVKWESVCKSKRSKGVRVKKLELFNLSLLDKWLRRFLGGGD